ncbi:hypothetical protein Tco_0847653 [Tanacetum coccineum]
MAILTMRARRFLKNTRRNLLLKINETISDPAEAGPTNLAPLWLTLLQVLTSRGLGYNAVPPPYTGNFMPPKPDLSFSGLEEFANEPIVSEPTIKKPVAESSEVKNSADKSKAVRKNNSASIIED